ncbi:MAG: zinc ribbon domain-containing protein [Bacilli bacterium]|jgi:hypothetical protein|nr:zinc ribbon domain-containing protein [Erysipelotrichia bacterium]
MNCKNCSYPLKESDSYCPNCGSPVEKDIYQRPTKTNSNRQVFGQSYSKYIFVVSLVLMIILVLNLSTAFNSLSGLKGEIQANASSLTSEQLSLFNKMLTLSQVETAFIFLNFGATLTLMIIAAMLRKKAKLNVAPEEALLKTQFYLSIAAVALGTIFVIYEIIALQKLNDIANQLGAAVHFGFSYLVLPITFVALLIPCIFKSLSVLRNN